MILDEGRLARAWHPRVVQPETATSLRRNCGGQVDLPAPRPQELCSKLAGNLPRNQGLPVRPGWTEKKTEGRIISTFKKVLAFFAALVVIGAIVAAGAGVTSAARGAEPVAKPALQSTALERGAAVLTQADQTPVPPLGVPFDPSGATVITVTTNIKPASTYLAAGEVIVIHGTLEDPSRSSASFTFNANSEILDLANKDADLGYTRNIGGDPLKVTVAGNDVTVETLNGAPIGPAVLFVVKAKADGLVGVDYDFAGLKGLLTGVAFRQFAFIDQRSGATVHRTVCYNYHNSVPLAPAADLYVLNNETAAVVTGSQTLDRRSVNVVMGTDTYGDPIATVSTKDGLMLGEFVTVCLTGSDTAQPFGTK